MCAAQLGLLILLFLLRVVMHLLLIGLTVVKLPKKTTRQLSKSHQTHTYIIVQNHRVRVLFRHLEADELRHSLVADVGPDVVDLGVCRASDLW